LADTLQLRQRGRRNRARPQRSRLEGQQRTSHNRPRGETLPNGRTVEKRVLCMSDDVALVVREAERVELAEVPPPLADQPGCATP
jgi:hypothetical protein